LVPKTIGVLGLKIAQVCPRYLPNVGGIPTHVKEISERLVRSNFELEILTTYPSEKFLNEQTIGGIKVRCFRSWAPRELFYFSEDLRKYLFRNSSNYDLVHAHNYHGCPALYAAYAKNRNRFVFSPHYSGMGETRFTTFLHTPYRLIGKKIFQSADAIICTSRYERRLLIDTFGIKSEKVSVIPNGVTLSDYGGLRKVQKNYRMILYVGRLVQSKGIHHLIRALPALDVDIRLGIVGTGPYYEDLLGLADRLGVKHRVVFHGGGLSRKQIAEKYAEADLVALLSRNETYGITVAEALASGTPCIVTDTSALTEWIDNTNCFGVTYPVDIHELVMLIERAIGKTVKEARIFDWDDVVRRLIEKYQSVIGVDPCY
jgi:glycosyltransferase involved in cell wall biosynthesis